MNGLDIIKARAFGAGGGSGGSGGGSELLDAVLEKTVSGKIVSNAASIGQYAFEKCSNLTGICLPYAKRIDQRAFNACTNLAIVDLSVVEEIGGYVFANCKIDAFIIRKNNGICASIGSFLFSGTGITKKTGYIYVPSALVGTYKAETNWSTYASQFRALEDYTVDGTIYGEMDWAKMAA